jgi:N-methylhydantoinase A
MSQRVEFAYRLALNNIAEGIVDITVARGVDPRDYAIMAYGSAGPMLIPAVLDLVHAKSVVVPPYPGVFSALGLLSTDLVYADSRSAYKLLTEDAADEINEIYEAMEESLLSHISASRDEVTVQRTLDGRYVGQTWDTPFVPVPSGKITGKEIEKINADFHDSYEERWGNRFPLPVEGVTYRVQVIVPTGKVEYEPIESGGGQPEPTGKTTLRFLGGGDIEASEFRRENLGHGDAVEGPAVIREDASTTQVCEGQIATIGEYGEITITRRRES